MIDCIFHNGLQDEAWHIQLLCIFTDFLFHSKVIAAAVFNNGQIIIHIFQLILQGYHVVPAVHHILKHGVKGMDQGDDVVRVLQLCHPDHIVQHIGYKMRVDLGLEEIHLNQPLLLFLLRNPAHQFPDADNHMVKGMPHLPNLVFRPDSIADRQVACRNLLHAVL